MLKLEYQFHIKNDDAPATSVAMTSAAIACPK